MTLNPAVGEAINSVVAQGTAVGLRLQGSSFNGFLLRALKGFQFCRAKSWRRVHKTRSPRINKTTIHQCKLESGHFPPQQHDQSS